MPRVCFGSVAAFPRTPNAPFACARKTKHPLLCQGYENLLNDGGEQWLLPLLATNDKTFPLLDIIEQAEPDWVEGDGRVYFATRNPALAVGKPIHFGMGVFWKASVHSWQGGDKTPQIDLGPYGERVRKFLRDETPFPENMGLMLGVSPRDKAHVSFTLPYRTKETGCHSFRFHVPGILYVLKVGKNLGADMPRACFARNPDHPIQIVDFSKSITSAGARFFGKARTSRKLIDYLGGEK